MTLTTSTRFASVLVDGADWRETAKHALEELQSARTDDDGMNLGFIYITDALAEDAGSIITLFKSVTGIEHWVGCTGIGVAGNGAEIVDKPAISAMIGAFDMQDVLFFTAHHESVKSLDKLIAPWLKTHQPMLVLAHGQGEADNLPVYTLDQVAESFGGFVAGGMTSSRVRHLHFGKEISEKGFGGAAFSDEIQVASMLSQGARPIGNIYEITKADGNVIIDVRDTKNDSIIKPEDAFHLAIKTLVEEKAGVDADKIVLKQNETGLQIPDEYKDLFQGEMHIGFPVAGSDQKDFLVRNILGIDPEEGALAVSETPIEGSHIQFVHRDDESVRADLSKMLVNMRSRIQKQQGVFAPKGGIYISCVARAMTKFDPESEIPGGEMKLIQEVLGDIPLTGFYGAGEISGGRIYGYTGVLLLFL